MLTSEPYKFWEYDLRIARNDERLGLSGNDLIVFYNSYPIELRLNDIRSDKIPISACDQTNPVHISGITFSEIWMTNPAYEGGKVQFIVLFSGSMVELINELRKPKGFDKILDKLGFK